MAREKSYRAGHKEERAALYMEWRQANPEKEAARKHRRRARLANAAVEVFDIVEAWNYWGAMCVYCGSTEGLTFDHIVPLLQRGSHSFDNLCVACKSCNSSKGAKKLIEWMWWKARVAAVAL